MPWKYVCSEHPDWTGDHLADSFDHAEAEHPGVVYEKLRPSIIDAEFTSQTEAQGNEPMRLGGCRACGASGPISESGYCYGHQAGIDAALLETVALDITTKGQVDGQG